MKLSQSTITPLQPSQLHVKSTLHADPQPIHISQQLNSLQDQLQIKSTLSTTERQKVPQTMKHFLKSRKLLRQFHSTPQPITQCLIQSRKNLLDSSTTPLDQTQIPNEHYSSQLFYQNHSQIHFNQRKKNQRPPSRQKSAQSIICPICEGEISKKNMVKAFTCRHIFCEECAKNYAKFKINMFQQVPCPEDSCASLLNTSTDFYKSFSKRQRRIYKKISNFYATQGDPLKKLCPKQECEGVIKLEESADVQFCPQCKERYCSNCFLEAHTGKCRDYEIKFMEDTLHYRQCAKCHIVVERIQGCNHITCKCGYEFCYICGAKWKHDHICNPDDLEDNGCDWGENWQDHFIFLMKLPLKFVLTTIYSAFWFGISFAAAPYNVFIFMYWILLIFVGSPGEYIFQQEERPLWEIILLLLIFPILMIYCLPVGIRIFLQKFEEQCPFISDGYRFIVRI